MAKTIREINEKIANGSVVVMTAEEFTRLAKEKDVSALAKEVDVVTTATFGPMCSSGAVINFGHWKPGIRMEEIEINGVVLLRRAAAVDSYIGATADSRYDNAYGRRQRHPGMVDGKLVHLMAPGKRDGLLSHQGDRHLDHQGYSQRVLPVQSPQRLPEYASGDQWVGCHHVHLHGVPAAPSEQRDLYPHPASFPPCSTIHTCGPWHRTTDLPWGGDGIRRLERHTVQYDAEAKRSKGIPLGGAATLAVVGNAKVMTTTEISIAAAYFYKYACRCSSVLGIPIPVLDEEMATRLSISKREIETVVCDYAQSGHIPPSPGPTMKSCAADAFSLSARRSIPPRCPPWQKPGRSPVFSPMDQGWEIPAYRTGGVISHESSVRPLEPRQMEDV
jgi:hypothetical protein